MWRRLCRCGWCVAVQDVASVGAVCFGGAVGVQDDLPAPPVDADVVVELAHENTIADTGVAAVFLMVDVVDVAPGGGPPAAGPGAPLVAQQDRAADVGGDVLGVADVQGEAGGVVGGGQQAGAQHGGEPARAGHEVDGEPGDGVPQCGVRLRGQPGTAAAGAGAGVCAAAVPGPVAVTACAAGVLVAVTAA